MVFAPGYKRTGGGAEGRKKCLSRVYQCPLRHVGLHLPVFFFFFHVFSPWLDVVWVLCDRTRWDAERSLCKELYEEEVDKVKGLVPEGMASGPF